MVEADASLLPELPLTLSGDDEVPLLCGVVSTKRVA